MDVAELRPIGVIRTPFSSPEGTPVQPCFSEGAEGEVVVDEAFAAGLQDLEGFDHVWLLYWLDRAGPWQPLVIPYLDDRAHGVFATRSPSRPNPLGLSVVRLLGREGRVLKVADVDMLDGTPLLDIKPYVARFDVRAGGRAGWFEDARVDGGRADRRFHAHLP